MPVSDETYLRVVLEDPAGHWELHCGRLVGKPLTTTEHNDVIEALHDQLRAQLPRSQFAIRTDTGRLRRPGGSYYEPDLFVLPRALVRRLREHPGTFEVYDEPMPLVVEVWSPSTGALDIEEKLPEYRRRGDLEIWRIHPYQRTLTVWRRQPDGSYTETVVRGGVIAPAALPGVTVDIDALFE